MFGFLRKKTPENSKILTDVENMVKKCIQHAAKRDLVTPDSVYRSLLGNYPYCKNLNKDYLKKYIEIFLNYHFCILDFQKDGELQNDH